MEKLCDLHVHSTCSDGTLTPRELVELARKLELGAVALCDHNTVKGLPAFLTAAEGSGVEAVPGVEFSTDWNGTELHILGLFIKPEHYEAVTDFTAEGNLDKERSNQELVAALAQIGYPLDYAAILASVPYAQINRAHIARAMVEAGYVPDVDYAFDHLLGEEHGYYRRSYRPDVMQTIEFIKSIGAAAVLAHPLLTLQEAPLREFVEQAVPHGLDGMETMYWKYSPQTTRLAGEIARSFGIKSSGGSDFHGENKPDTAMGSGRGDLAVPMTVLDALR